MDGAGRVQSAAIYAFLLIAPVRILAQIFSIDFQGPTISQLDQGSSTPITEADLLMASPAGTPAPGPIGRPTLVVFGGPTAAGPNLGLSAYGAAVGHAPGVPGFIEVDALSFGNDYLLRPEAVFSGVWVFSVDEFSSSYQPPSPGTPSVSTEGSAGAADASADVFVTYPPAVAGPGPMGPGTLAAVWNAALIDGNGVAPPAAAHPSLTSVVGWGVVEPSPGTAGVPDMGDNVDAVDVDTVGPTFPVFFSLDAGFTDPIEGPPVNSGSAPSLGFSGADILMTSASGVAPVLYASAETLGLDIFGFDTDDVDALVLLENGVAGYQRPSDIFDWGPGGGDMLFFSVRRGSAIIGILDSLFSAAIEPGDILTPNFGGPGVPSIWLAADNLGLLTTRFGFAVPDDLDALDVSADCNANAVPDRLDIALGLDVDCDENGIPDGCETPCGDGTCCASERCACVPDCGTPPASEALLCSDQIDNDCDGDTDCTDADCVSGPDCTGGCGNMACTPPEDSCNCPADCAAPPANEIAGMTCNDGADNDCDGSVDCDDSDCADDPACDCLVDTDCSDGDACTCNECTPNGCVFTPTVYGDMTCDGITELADILCILDGYAFFEDCPNADLAPCTGDGIVELADVLAALDAYADIDLCGCP